jgi:hypothetical protein
MAANLPEAESPRKPPDARPPAQRFVLHRDAMNGEAETDPEGGSDASARPRRAANVFIALFLLYQLAMPLSYYLGDGGYDERFSWRMFSTLRLQRCDVAVQERIGGEGGTLRQVPLVQELQVAWINMLKRYRTDVVQKFMASRCRGDDVYEVRYVRRCADTDGSLLPATGLTMTCQSGEVREVEGSP